MDNATVEGDCIGEIIYRNICPSDSKRETKSIVKGKVQFTKLYSISPNSFVHPIKPTLKNPCWSQEALIGRTTLPPP